MHEEKDESWRDIAEIIVVVAEVELEMSLFSGTS